MMVRALNQTHQIIERQADFTANKNYRPQDVHQNLEAAESRRQLGHFENHNFSLWLLYLFPPCI